MSWKDWTRKIERKKEIEKGKKAKEEYLASMTVEERARYEKRREINRANGARSIQSRKILARDSRREVTRIEEEDLRNMENAQIEKARQGVETEKVLTEVYGTKRFEDWLEIKAGTMGIEGESEDVESEPSLEELAKQLRDGDDYKEEE